MAPTKPEVMYWKSESGARADIVRSLEADGFAVKVANRLEDILDYLMRRTLAAVVVDASMSETETISRARELSSSEKLYKIPLLFLSNGGKDACASLARQFNKFVSLSGDIDPVELLAHVDEACQRPAKSDSRPLSGEAGGAKSGKSTDEIRLYFSHHLDPSRLVSSYGGTVFAFASRPGVFDDQYLIPPHQKHTEIAALLSDLTKTNRDLGTHVRRVCYVGSALANGAGFTRQQDEVIRASALLLNITLTENPDLAKLDLLYDEIEQNVEELAQAYSQAANVVQEQIADSNISRTIQLVSDILRRREMFDSREQILSSQCVILAELTGRACWKNGLWSMNGAHRVIRELRQEKRYALDRALTSSMCRILSEASSARHASEKRSGKAPTPEQATIQRMLLDEAKKEAADLFADTDQTDIDITDIRSGMRLSAPLTTQDGKLVLRSNVRLDQTIIWSLWQLLAIAPLHRTLKIVEASTEASTEKHRSEASAGND